MKILKLILDLLLKLFAKPKPAIEVKAHEPVFVDLDLLDELAHEAANYVGVTEEGGDNRGQMVEAFQKAVSIPAGSSWCLAFVFYCIGKVESRCQSTSPLFKTGHVLTCWNRSPKELRLEQPTVGSVMMFKHTDSTGHAEIVTKIISKDYVETIGGNTSDSKDVNREGDGVYQKVRSTKGSQVMQVLGYLKPFEPQIAKVKT